ncbi:MAG: hypothetical protein A4E57_02496 [Syntrophorhabdaceae bacterium PtaU1.Bin034]|jgi:PAS domain S-box-containing protein|nr:MAG: hypothetical protein A4E57_02496 [Syntrophorhabdaceae bacterium PtaU1.Bin034]
MEINLDITRRKQAEIAAQLAYAYNRSLIEASLDPLVTIMLDGEISDVNKATESITGCTRRELVGTTSATTLPSRRRHEQGTTRCSRQAMSGTTH